MVGMVRSGPADPDRDPGAVSTVFGEFADKREALAAANPIDDAKLDGASTIATRCPTANSGSIIVADTGDGWNPTYAIARLLAAEEHPAASGRRRIRCRAGGCSSWAATRSTRPPRRRNMTTGCVYPFDEAYRLRRRRKAGR